MQTQATARPAQPWPQRPALGRQRCSALALSAGRVARASGGCRCQPELADVESPAPAGLDRRTLLLAALAGSAALLLGPIQEAHAGVQQQGLRSLASRTPCLITFRNEHDRLVKVYWVNYAGDQEFFAAIPAGGWWSVYTFESHPWRVVDGESGQLLREVVAAQGASLVRIDPLGDAVRAQPVAGPGMPPAFDGWDGIGGAEGEYVAATIAEIGLDHLGGVALLAAKGYDMPVPIAVGINDAAQLFHAAGPEFRRPSTMSLWVRSLQAAGATVDRVLITRLVGTTVYARIILSVPGGELRSLDARPSDSLALAMQTNAPLFIGRRLAASLQPGALELELGDWSEQRPPTPSTRDSPPVPAQASYAHTRKA